MIKRNQVFVRAIKKDGKYGTVDILDLDDLSFRVFILSVLVDSGVRLRTGCSLRWPPGSRRGALGAMKPEVVPGKELELREKG